MLVITDTSSSELRPDGLGRRPAKVEVTRQEASGAHWLDASHDGYARPFGAVHRRQQFNVRAQQDARGSFVFTGAAAGSIMPTIITAHIAKAKKSSGPLHGLIAGPIAMPGISGIAAGIDADIRASSQIT